MILAGYVTCPKTFSEKSPTFEELVAVFSNIIQQERDFVAGQLFASSYVWNDRPSFCRTKKLDIEDNLYQMKSTLRFYG